jgi:PAS domain S-box-containing protein
MLGWTADELHGRPMHDTVHFQRADGTAVPAAESPLLKVRTEGRPVRILDDVFVRKNGSVLPVSYSSAPLQRGSTIRGVVVAFRDITEEKKARAGVEQELTTLTWIGRIRDALDEHRFVLYSQPLVPLTGGRPGQELLLRMVDRDGQVIAPGAFLPIAEKYGLISEIDRWVIAQAIEVAARTREVINVNVSAATLGATDLLPYIEGQLSQAGADPADLVIEITETALMHDSDAGEAFAHGLAAIGCGLALDDFGTGFGGFTYLKRLPVSHLKIDAEFTRDLLTNPSNRHVIQAIVSLSRAFGVRTTAEGVEDGETLEALRAEGVDFAQGYHLGRPTPVNRGERRRLRTADVVASGDIQLPLRTWISRPS